MKIKYKSNAFIIILDAILAGIGLIGLIIGIFLVSRTINFNNNSEKIEATVDACEKESTQDSNGKITITYQNYVNYNFNGVQYNHIILSGVNNALAVGDKIEIRININNPEDVRMMNQTSFVSIALIVISLLVLGGFTYLLIASYINKKEDKNYIKDGIRVEAKVTRVYPEKNVFNYNNQYFVLDCECMEKKFTSKPFKYGYDISEGDIVPVYYKSIQKGQYFVDVENTIINKKKNEEWRFK